MSRVQLIFVFIVLLVVATILLIISFVSNREKGFSPKTSIVAGSYYIFDDQKVGNGYLSVSDPIFYLVSKVDKIQRKDNRVEAKITTLIGNRFVNQDILIFDKSVYPLFFLNYIADKSLPFNAEAEKVLNDQNIIMNEAKKIEGKLSILVFNTKRSTCNKLFLSSLKTRKGGLNCLPIATQINVYAK